MVERAGQAVIVAAGTGERVGGDTPKQFRDLGGRSVLAWSVEAFTRHPGIDAVVVVVASDRVEEGRRTLPSSVRVVAGGATRAASVRAGVEALGDATGPVLVHDGVRPFVSQALIDRVLEASRSGPAIPAIPVADTIKRVTDDGIVVETVPRAELRAVQTPQGCPRELLAAAYALAGPEDAATDDASLLERAGVPVRTVPGEAGNFKITTPDDLALARWLVERDLAGRAAAEPPP